MFRTFVTYSGVFTVLISAIGYSYHFPTGSTIGTVQTADVSALQDNSSVDKVTALQVAGDIAKQSDLPIAANIANLSISLDAQNKISQSDAEIIAKPQIINPMTGNRSVHTYTAKDGDTAQSIADKFNVNAQTIQWANNLTSDVVKPGSDVTVPPVNGVIHNVKDGDSVESIADKYQSDKTQIVMFNDLELSGITAGQQLILPDGTLPTEEQPGYIAPTPTNTMHVSSSSQSSSSSLVNGYSPVTTSAGGNAYAFGNCTSWAYERRAQLGHPVGSYWGNAATWDSFGRAAGYAVDKTPTVGSVFQMPAFIDAYTGSYGHVGIVESINPNGSIYVSEMNYAGNFNRVTYRTIPAGQAALYNYIH